MSVAPDAGDRYEQFLRLFAQDRDRIFAAIKALLPHQADAEDVFQHCSILLWRKFDQFDPGRSFLAWACGVAFYEVRNFLRAASRDRLQFDAELMTQLETRRLETLPELDRRLEALRGCLQQLQGADRELVRSAYDERRSLKSLAATSGRALQTLYNRLNLLRRKLLECVERKLAMETGA
jgi:RNA polymerase sigma-70 factor (ECF subfamily)